MHFYKRIYRTVCVCGGSRIEVDISWGFSLISSLTLFETESRAEPSSHTLVYPKFKSLCFPYIFSTYQSVNHCFQLKAFCQQLAFHLFLKWMILQGKMKWGTKFSSGLPLLVTNLNSPVGRLPKQVCHLL